MTDIGPVGESEMREFFGRLVTTFVAYSDQDKRIRDLEFRLEGQGRQLEELRQSEAKLKQSEQDAWQLTGAVEKERDDAKATVQAQSSTIESLQGQVSSLNAGTISLTNDASQLRNEVASLKGNSERLDREVRDANASVEYWRQRALKSEEAHEATQVERDKLLSANAQLDTERQSWETAHAEVSAKHEAAQGKLTAIETALSGVVKSDLAQSQPEPEKPAEDKPWWQQERAAQ